MSSDSFLICVIDVHSLHMHRSLPKLNICLAKSPLHIPHLMRLEGILRHAGKGRGQIKNMYRSGQEYIQVRSGLSGD